jgi:hypothetical protein
MQLTRQILLTVLTVALAAYAFDCSAMTTPEQAMQCCDSMHCSTQGHHGQDCCKTMPTMHASFVQPSVTRIVSFSPTVALFPAFSEPSGLDFSGSAVVADSHAPPNFYPTALQPLRI